MRILAIIPARGGSKGIPKKNIVPLAGKPLILYTIEAAQLAKSLDRIVVSTDSFEISELCQSVGCEVLSRPAALSVDYTTTLSVLQHALEVFSKADYFPDAVMTLQPTSPFRTFKHIDDATKLFMADVNADSLVSCTKVPHVFHPYSVMREESNGYLVPFLGKSQPCRRQDKETIFARNGAAIYITRTNRLSQFVFGGNLIPFMMDSCDSIDIDTPEDLLDAEIEMAKRSVTDFIIETS